MSNFKLGFFFKNSKNYEEIKTLLRKAINFTDLWDIKSQILQNLSIVIYFECKTQNKICVDQKLMTEKFKTQKNYTQNTNNNISQEDRIKRKISNQDKLKLKEEMNLINEEKKISSKKDNDFEYKHIMKNLTKEYQDKENLFIKTAMGYEDENKNRIFDENYILNESSLIGSK